jgi:predicted  nucleic acid-binding Zn-ribbon protein
MLFEPTLIVRELLVTRGEYIAYREHFRKGVNIISGENSSGKSTLLNLLVYGLGADVSHWSEHAKLCDRVRVEVELNGKPAVFSREISDRPQQPMDIFGGTLEEAEAAPISEWHRYPYKSSQSKHSFSQAIFRLLDVPELETETTGKITIHQILRLLYSDQMTPAENIFRAENFDSPTVREAIGRFLLGAYDTEIYANELRLKALRGDLQTVSGSLTSLYKILGTVKHSLTLEWAAAERTGLSQRLERVYADIADLEGRIQENSSSEDGYSLEPQRDAYQRVRELQQQLGSIDEEINSLELEVADSQLFITDLGRKIAALQDSSSTAEAVAGIRYVWCPSCFSRLPDEDDGDVCRLCKVPFDKDRMRSRIVSQMNEMRIQLEQSQTLQRSRAEALNGLERRREEVRGAWARAQAELQRVRRAPTTEARDRLRKLTESAGYLRREIDEIEQKAALIEQLDQLSRQKEELSAEIARLEDRNERLRASEQERLLAAYKKVADETVWFLRHDLPRQDSFERATSVNFSFEKDRTSIDGQSYFSASSTVLLKNSLLCGFLFAAARDPSFRHFRFAILDTLEDKGMEPERSQNFQKLLVDRSQDVTGDHQLIFATAMIAPELANSEYVIGEFSTHDERTLAIL